MLMFSVPNTYLNNNVLISYIQIILIIVTHRSSSYVTDMIMWTVQIQTLLKSKQNSGIFLSRSLNNRYRYLGTNHKNGFDG